MDVAAWKMEISIPTNREVRRIGAAMIMAV
jgi:hypothetical protein